MKSKIFSNAFIHLFGRIFGMALVLITGGIVKSQGTDLAGDYVIPKSYLWIFATILDFGIYLILVRMLAKAKSQKEKEKIFGNFVGFRIITAGIVYTLALVLMLFTPYSQEIKRSIVILAFGQFLVDINQVFTAVFQVNFKLWKLVLGETIGRITILALTVLGYFLEVRVEFLILFIVLGNLANFMTSYYFVNQNLRIRPSFNYKKWKNFLAESLPLGIAMMFTLAYFRIDSLLLSLMKEENISAIYEPAYRLTEYVGIFPQILMGAFFPEIAKASKQKAIQVCKKVVFLMTAVAILGSFLTYFLAPLIVKIFTFDGSGFTDSFQFEIFNQEITAEGSITIMRLLIWSSIFSFPTSVLNYTMISHGKQKLMILPAFVGVIFSVILNLILIEKYSFIGAGMTTFMTTFIVFILTVFTFYKNFMNKHDSDSDSGLKNKIKKLPISEKVQQPL